ncbi:ABC transporter ATP-binding protein [Verrucomicrobiaceae bacterium N1E253]|uniref:ABC transporter ATP-binding protein n=1 Tax=Oceaniferula marina TaxID=2748318 RepID=A0A851GGP7_9BACT|nr:ABC transporter ATP-binding protein [Oceaniferula marina]
MTVEGLTKQFGALTAVDGIDMSIRRGQVHGFLGPNGSGKTTAIRMMCGLMQASRGNISVLGMPVPEQAAIVRRHVGYMTQRFSLYEDMTVRENMRFLCQVHGMKRQRRRERISEVLEQFNLEPLTHQRVGPMSGGQKRRIALAAAVLTQPELLILDEPTSEVDPNTRREMWEHFFNLAQQGTTLLVSTHLMDEAERCHHLTIMNQGRIVADGAVMALKQSLPNQVLEVKGGEVTPMVPVLAALDSVSHVSQVGIALRVLSTKNSARHDILEVLPSGMSVEPVAASIEDVFVQATSEGRRA